jgi:hypothetical protein
METLAIIRQAIREESMSHTRKFQTRRDQKEARQVKNQEHDFFFLFNIKGIVHKEFCPGRPNSQFHILL